MRSKPRQLPEGEAALLFQATRLTGAAASCGVGAASSAALAPEDGGEAQIGEHRDEGEQGTERQQAVAGPVDARFARGGRRGLARGADHRGGAGGGGRGGRGGAGGGANNDGPDHSLAVVRLAEVLVGTGLLEGDRAGGAVGGHRREVAALAWVKTFVPLGCRADRARANRVRAVCHDREGDGAADRDVDRGGIPPVGSGAVVRRG